MKVRLFQLLSILTITAFFNVANGIIPENAEGINYEVGIKDVLEINVLDHNGLRTLAPVASDGTITFPYIGTVMVKGKEISEIEGEITKRLSEGYINYPVVTVSLVKAMSRKIYAYGELNKRGEVPYDDNMTVIQALSMVGGISKDGQYGRLIIRRKLNDKGNEYGELLQIDVNKGLIESRQIEDTLLMPDDILIVEQNKTFLIEGEVAQRGRFVLEKDLTVLRALLQAGGVTKDASYGRIKVRRKQEGDTGGYEVVGESKLNERDIENKEVEDIILMPDDILIVEQNKTFLIEGEVAQRGRFVLEKDMTVLKALLLAGGVTKDASYGRIKVRRKQEGKFGEYTGLVESAINDRVIEDSKVEDVVLQPDDILIVGRNKTFFIYGETQKTGEFILTDNLTVFQALTIAGGFSKWGSGSRVRILRPKSNQLGYEKIKVNIDDVLDGDASADVYLKPKDTIVVSSGIF